MMFYAIVGEDRPDSLAERLAARPAHVERLKALQDEGRSAAGRSLSGHRFPRSRAGWLLGQPDRCRVRFARSSQKLG
jgi:hypothetical protein